MSETLTFSLELDKVEVVLSGPEGDQNYTLREMTGKHRDIYLDRLSAKMKVDVHGNTSVKSFEGLQSNLVSRCLFDAEGNNVSEEIVQTFPSKVQAALFKEAQRINALDEDEETSKND